MCVPAGRPGAQAEALSALLGVAQNYGGALQPHWHQLSAFALQQLQANLQVRPWMSNVSTQPNSAYQASLPSVTQ